MRGRSDSVSMVHGCLSVCMPRLSVHVDVWGSVVVFQGWLDDGEQNHDRSNQNSRSHGHEGTAGDRSTSAITFSIVFGVGDALVHVVPISIWRQIVCLIVLRIDGSGQR